MEISFLNFLNQQNQFFWMLLGKKQIIVNT